MVALLLSAGACRIDRGPESGDTSVGQPEEIAERVSTLRGLSIERPIEHDVMSHEQYRARLERMYAETDPAEVAATEVAMKRLGLVPADYELERQVIDFRAESIGGFYDAEEQRLYIILGWTPSSISFDEGLMAHEVDHALQDQHFDLRRFQETDDHEADAALARTALVEGDALVLAYEYETPVPKPWADPAVAEWLADEDLTAGLDPWKWPRILTESFRFPYAAGGRFVAHMRQHHPWTRIDEIYERPPLSTEHILHPIKYEAYELPDRVQAKLPPSLADHSNIYENVFGELGVGVFLREHGVEMGKAEMAAQGWGGDRLVVYAPSGHEGGVAGTIGVWYSVWDHPDEAREFFDPLADIEVTADRRGDAVVIVFADSSERASSLLDEIWREWTATRH